MQISVKLQISSFNIQAGKERALVREPKAILEDGDYPTEAKLLMGANKHEGMNRTKKICNLIRTINNSF